MRKIDLRALGIRRAAPFDGWSLRRNAAPVFDAYAERPLILDGAMGTCIQQYDLTADDFDGQDGCNEILVKTRPDVIGKIHAAYFEAGCDAVETNTFGATSLVLGEYDLQDQTYEINRAAAALAKDVARQFSSVKPRWAVGSIGPTTKLPSLGHIRFSDLKAAYLPQIEGLIDGGADLLLVETCQDLLQSKAALAAIRQVQRAKARICLLSCRLRWSRPARCSSAWTLPPWSPLWPRLALMRWA